MSWNPEAFSIGSKAAYLWCPNGIIESKVAQAFSRATGEAATTRNWATVLKLHAMVAAGNNTAEGQLSLSVQEAGTKMRTTNIAIAIAIGLTAMTNLTWANEEDSPGSISSQEALQIVRDRFSKLCEGQTFDCPIGAQKSVLCPFLFIVVVKLPESESGPRSVGIWVSLEKRGRVIAISDAREVACGSA